ncbi:MAG: hypothetical protein ACRDOH_32010 [Streptosporangiaceae bacterium]
MAGGLQDAPRHAGKVVRRVLLRRNIAVDAETTQLVADAVQAALHAGAPSRPPRRRRRVPPPAAPPCSDPAEASFLAPLLAAVRTLTRGQALTAMKPAEVIDARPQAR